MSAWKMRLPAVMLGIPTLLLSGCGLSSPPTTPPEKVIASTSPTLQSAPAKTGGILGLEVELSSATAQPGEVVEATIRAPKELVGEELFILSKGDNGAEPAVAVPGASIGDDGVAYVTFSLDETTTFQAVVPKEDVEDLTSWNPDTKTAGQSEEFTIVVDE